MSGLEKSVTSGLYCRPVFYAADIAASVGHYVACLGFTANWSVDGDDGRPVCAQVTRDGTEIILWRDSRLPTGGRVYISLHRPEQVDALHAELLARGATIVHAPSPKPWGAYCLTAQDLDRNELYFVGERA